MQSINNTDIVLDSMISTRARRPLSRCLLPFPPPPSSTTSSSTSTSTSAPTRRHQETYLILHPKDDKSERRLILIPPPSAAPIRVGRVVNPKTPAKLDNLLFDTKVLSRNHAEVFSDGMGRVYIRDLGSSNGTYINGFRLSMDGVPSEPYQLIVGQELVWSLKSPLPWQWIAPKPPEPVD
jgi:pSer/pThr/pTyr-binding forkhead associated (FHA) protein